MVLNEIVKKDLYRYTGKPYTFGGFIRTFLKTPGLRFTFYLRMAESQNQIIFIRWFYKLMIRKCQFKFGFQISSRTKIDAGFYIGHIGTIVVTHNAVIGKNCNINHGVTIGQASRGRNKGAPTIGDYVWMGANSTIVGKITIGNNVLIAPGSLVNKDVPDNSMVIGNPSVITPRTDATEGYLNRVID